MVFAPPTVLYRFYKTNIIEASNAKRYALNSWEGATPEARQAYVGADSFDEYYDKIPKELPNLRYGRNVDVRLPLVLDSNILGTGGPSRHGWSNRLGWGSSSKNTG